MSRYALMNGVIYTGSEVLYQHAVIINDDKFVNDTAYEILRFLKHDNIGDKFVSSRHYVNILNKEYVIHVLDKEELSEISIELNKEIEKLKSISKCLED